MSGIFISYRRSDSLDVVGRIYDRLITHFPAPSIYRDIDSMQLGKSFPRQIRDKLDASATILVVIGPNWIDSIDTQGRRRLDDPNDFVRLEIELALATGKPVIPVLVASASFPDIERLPDSLKPLAHRHGVAIRQDPDFHRDMDRLVTEINPLLAVSADSRFAPTKAAELLVLPTPPISAPKRESQSSNRTKRNIDNINSDNANDQTLETNKPIGRTRSFPIRAILGCIFLLVGFGIAFFFQRDISTYLSKSNETIPHSSQNGTPVASESTEQPKSLLKREEENLDLLKSKKGVDHPDTLKAMNDLAASYIALRRLDDARAILKQSLAHGSDSHPQTQADFPKHEMHTAWTHVLIGSLEKEAGNYSVALDFYAAAEGLYERLHKAGTLTDPSHLARLKDARLSFARCKTVGRHAGIEISSTAVRAIIIEYKIDGSVEGIPLISRGWFEKRTGLITTVIQEERDGKRVRVYPRKALDDVANTVKEIFDLLIASEKIDATRVCVVASSGVVAGAENVNELSDILKTNVKLLRRMEPFSPGDEFLLAYLGIMRGQDRPTSMFSILVDIDAANTRIGYVCTDPQGKYSANETEVGYGTKTLKYAADGLGKKETKPFPEAAALVATTEFAPKLSESVRTLRLKAGIAAWGRDKVFLVGGAPYAIATLMAPSQIDSDTVPISYAMLREYKQKLSNKSPFPFSKRPTDKQMAARFEAELKNIRNVFTTDQLIAGAEAIESVFMAFDLKRDNDTVTFAHKSIFAWLIGYVDEATRRTVK